MSHVFISNEHKINRKTYIPQDEVENYEKTNTYNGIVYGSKGKGKKITP